MNRVSIHTLKIFAVLIFFALISFGCSGGGGGSDNADNAAPEADESSLTASIVSPGDNEEIYEGGVFNFNSSVSGGKSPYTYVWNFDGGAVGSTEKDPGEVVFGARGTYNINFTVTDYDGATISDNATVSVVEEDTNPSANIISPNGDTTIAEGGSLHFKGNASFDNSPASFKWTFDGAASDNNSEEPGEMTFSTARQEPYTVTFSVTDADGDISSDAVNITVVPYLNTAPSAEILSPDEDRDIFTGESIIFQGSVSNGNAPFTYLWNFDGAARLLTQASPGEITFNKQGTYTIRFNVTDAEGDSSEDSVVITVIDPFTVSIVTPEENPTVINTGHLINFEAICTGGNPPFSYEWDFSGAARTISGTVNTLENLPQPQITFNTAGLYTATLRITDNTTETQIDSTTVIVQ